MEINDSEWKILLTGTRCNLNNLYYLDRAHIERALAIARHTHSLPHSAQNLKVTPQELALLKMKILKYQKLCQKTVMKTINLRMRGCSN